MSGRPVRLALLVSLLVGAAADSSALAAGNATIILSGNSQDLRVQVSRGTASELVARLTEFLGVRVRYEGAADKPVDASLRGPLLRVLSQFFPGDVIVVKNDAGRVTEVMISEVSSSSKASSQPHQPVEHQIKDDAGRVTEQMISEASSSGKAPSPPPAAVEHQIKDDAAGVTEPVTSEANSSGNAAPMMGGTNSLGNAPLSPSPPVEQQQANGEVIPLSLLNMLKGRTYWGS